MLVAKCWLTDCKWCLYQNDYTHVHQKFYDLISLSYTNKKKPVFPLKGRKNFLLIDEILIIGKLWAGLHVFEMQDFKPNL